MDKEFKAAIERVERAEELAPPGSHEHDMYVKAALMAAWPTFKAYAELLRRGTGQLPNQEK